MFHFPGVSIERLLVLLLDKKEGRRAVIIDVPDDYNSKERGWGILRKGCRQLIKHALPAQRVFESLGCVVD